MAAGNLEYKSIGNKVGVIAEPSELKGVSFDIRETQNYLDKMEKYIGVPFAWQEFTVLLLPGLMTSEVAGMENPYLTIVQNTNP
jgi:hypothetical protein